MQDFLKEWGPAIITAVAVLIIIGIVVAFKGNLTTQLTNLINTFGTQVNNNLPTP